MSGTELVRAADRLAREPSLTAPSFDRIATRVEQRRRRRRGVFAGSVAVLAFGALGAVSLQSDDPEPVIATGPADAAASTQIVPAEGVPHSPHTGEAADEGGDGGWWADSEGALALLGGDVDVSVRREPFDQEVADELAGSADEVLQLDEVTAYVVRDGDRVRIGVVSAEGIVRIDVPAGLVPGEAALKDLVDSFGSFDGIIG